MKTMNYTLLIAFLIFGMGCSNQEDYKTDELTATEFMGNEAQETHPLSEPLVHLVYLEQELSFLNCQQENLIVDVDNEVPGALEELEENQRLIEQNIMYSEYLDETIAKRFPCTPGKNCPKPKPNPCTEEKGCVLNCPIMIPDFSTIVSTTGNIEVTFGNGDGEVCGEMGELEQVDENLFEAPFETNGCCDGFMEVTKEFEAAPEGQISYQIPITCNH